MLGSFLLASHQWTFTVPDSAFLTSLRNIQGIKIGLFSFQFPLANTEQPELSSALLRSCQRMARLGPLASLYYGEA